MPRPGRMYEIDATNYPGSWINVAEIPTLQKAGGGSDWTIGFPSFTLHYTSEALRDAAFEVWRARIDDAP